MNRSLVIGGNGGGSAHHLNTYMGSGSREKLYHSYIAGLDQDQLTNLLSKGVSGKLPAYVIEAAAVQKIKDMCSRKPVCKQRKFVTSLLIILASKKLLDPMYVKIAEMHTQQ